MLPPGMFSTITRAQNSALLQGFVTFCHRADSETCLLLRLRPGDLVEFDREVSSRDAQSPQKMLNLNKFYIPIRFARTGTCFATTM